MWYFAYGSNLNSRAVAEWCRHYGFRPPSLKPGNRPRSTTTAFASLFSANISVVELLTSFTTPANMSLHPL